MKRPSLLFVAIVAVTTVAFLFDGNLEGNELDTLALAKHLSDPSYIPGAVMPLLAVSIAGRLAVGAALPRKTRDANANTHA